MLWELQARKGISIQILLVVAHMQVEGESPVAAFLRDAKKLKADVKEVPFSPS